MQSFSTTNTQRSTLVGATIVMRHGSRTPKERLSTLVAPSSVAWPFKDNHLGSLTPRGFQEGVITGVRLQRKYAVLLSDTSRNGCQLRLENGRCWCKSIYEIADSTFCNWWVTTIAKYCLRDCIKIVTTESARCIATGSSLLGGILAAMVCECAKQQTGFSFPSKESTELVVNLGRKLALALDTSLTTSTEGCSSTIQVVHKASPTSQMLKCRSDVLKPLKRTAVQNSVSCQLAALENKDLIATLAAQCGWQIPFQDRLYEVATTASSSQTDSSTKDILESPTITAISTATGHLSGGETSSVIMSPPKSLKWGAFPPSPEEPEDVPVTLNSNVLVDSPVSSGLHPWISGLALLKRFCSFYDSFISESYSLPFVTNDVGQASDVTSSPDHHYISSNQHHDDQYDDDHKSVVSYAAIKRLARLYACEQYCCPRLGWLIAGTLATMVYVHGAKLLLGKQYVCHHQPPYATSSSICGNDDNKAVDNTAACMWCRIVGSLTTCLQCIQTTTTKLTSSCQYCCPIINGTTTSRQPSTFSPRLVIYVTHQSTLLGLQGALRVRKNSIVIPEFGSWIAAEFNVVSPGVDDSRDGSSSSSTEDWTVKWTYDDGNELQFDWNESYNRPSSKNQVLSPKATLEPPDDTILSANSSADDDICFDFIVNSQTEGEEDDQLSLCPHINNTSGNLRSSKNCDFSASLQQNPSNNTTQRYNDDSLFFDCASDCSNSSSSHVLVSNNGYVPSSDFTDQLLHYSNRTTPLPSFNQQPISVLTSDNNDAESSQSVLARFVSFERNCDSKSKLPINCRFSMAREQTYKVTPNAFNLQNDGPLPEEESQEQDQDNNLFRRVQSDHHRNQINMEDLERFIFRQWEEFGTPLLQD